MKRVTRCGCWSHVRRKLVDALPKDHSLLPSSQAAVGVEYCNRLFALEKKFTGLSPENRHIQRQELSKPVLDAFFAWADSCKPAAGTALSKAIAYALSEKKYLLAFLEDPLVPISNNRVISSSIEDPQDLRETAQYSHFIEKS